MKRTQQDIDSLADAGWTIVVEDGLRWLADDQGNRVLDGTLLAGLVELRAAMSSAVAAVVAHIVKGASR